MVIFCDIRNDKRLVFSTVIVNAFYFFIAAITIDNQPNIKNNPPIGVYATDEHFPPEVPKPSEEEILNEMRETVERFKKVLSKPVVDIDTIVWADWDKNMDGLEEDWDEDED